MLLSAARRDFPANYDASRFCSNDVSELTDVLQWIGMARKDGYGEAS